MEEKDIKELWKQGDDLTTDKYSQETIEQIIQSKPKDIVSKFIKTLKMELWMNMVALTLLAVYLIVESEWMYAIGVTVLNVLTYIYYSSLIKKLNKETIDAGVAQYLCSVYKIIQRFILHYKIALWVSVIPAFFFGVYSSSLDLSNSEKYLYSPMFYISIIVALGICLLFTYLIFHFLYGKKANKIKKMVDALEQEETE